MKFTPDFLKLLIFILAALISLQSHAAAWTQSQGSWQTILSANAYESDHAFDKNGKNRSTTNKFNKYEFNPFVEYGYRDDITFGANPTFEHWQIDSSKNKTASLDFRGCGAANIIDSNESSGDIVQSEFFIRKRLIEKGNAVFSVQPLIKTPCILINNNNAKVAWNTYALEIRALAGYGFKWDPDLLGAKLRPFAGQYHFADIEMAYRKRGNNLSDQLKIDGTLGFRFNKDLLMLAQVFSVISTGEEYIGKVETSPNIFAPRVDNYGDVKLQLSGVVQATRTSSIQIGVYGDVYGKNYGAGNGIIMSLWKGF